VLQIICHDHLGGAALTSIRSTIGAVFIVRSCPGSFCARRTICRPSAEDTSAFAAIGQPPSVESYFPLSAADRFVVGIAAGSELSFETGVPLLANPGGGRGVEVAWEGSVDGATGVPLCPSPVLDSL
jgi:hypothetical protein